MNFDFNLILVPITLLFFGMWLLEKFIFKQRKTKGKGNENALIAVAYEFWPLLMVFLLLRSFFYEPYNIPSDSMVPTLETGDFILVKKYAYGVRLPLTHGKLLNTGKPKRGDVAVFRFPLNPNTVFIKRVIGLPGDVIRFDHNQLHINDEKIPKQNMSFERSPDIIKQLNTGERKEPSDVQDKIIQRKQALEAAAIYSQETLSDHSYFVREFDHIWPLGEFVAQKDSRFIPSQGTRWQITVPEHSYFVLGDNRDQSQDSRFWGFVPEENLVGRASFVWMHKAPGIHLPSFAQARKIQ